jgi:hypothetical protein
MLDEWLFTPILSSFESSTITHGSRRRAPGPVRRP